jgi:hypothetical protein
MLSAIALAMAATTGIEVGWQPTEDGKVEYILQLDAAAIEVLEGGDVFTSDIPSNVQDVRRLQISIGTRKLPRKLPPKKAPPPIAAAETPREPAKFTPDETAQPLVPPGEGGTKLAKGGAKKSADGPTGVVPAEAVSPLEALMNKKSSTTANEPAATKASPEPALAPVAEESRPWLPFVGALLGLFGSLGANVFLGWMWFGERNRYRSALARLAPRQA